MKPNLKEMKEESTRYASNGDFSSDAAG